MSSFYSASFSDNNFLYLFILGGNGFAAHQDTPAYIGLAQNHITAMVAVDAATILNGCLQLTSGRFGPKDSSSDSSLQSVSLTAGGILCAEDEVKKIINFYIV